MRMKSSTDKSIIQCRRTTTAILCLVAMNLLAMIINGFEIALAAHHFTAAIINMQRVITHTLRSVPSSLR